jgi:oxalate decarboxylase/phosphoglucose isomerase-like protein (cupin superfamily)
MNILPMPAGARANAHYHKGIETIAYLLRGECIVYYGDNLEHRVLVRAGGQIFLPADVPHAPCNESGAPCTGSWCIHLAAIRTASFYCRSLMRALQQNRERGRDHAALHRLPYRVGGRA